LCDEANIESHAFWEKFSNMPSWKNAFMDRVSALVKRDKNHPSVIYWSMGNESGFGPNHVAVSNWTRSYDPTRPVHYNPAGTDASIDIIAPMYPSVEGFVGLAARENRPVIMCEYAHAMGNSVGNLKEYWEPVYSLPRAQGGFVWDWIDQGFFATHSNGKKFIANGGQMNDPQSEKLVAFDGLINADRTIQPELLELKYIMQPLRFSAIKVQEGKFKVKNWHESTNASYYDIRWDLIENGKVVQNGQLPLSIAPQEEKEFTIAFNKPNMKAGANYFFHIFVTLKAPTTWADKGHEVSHAEFELPNSLPAKQIVVKDKTKIKLESDGTQLKIKGDNFSIAFSKVDGNLSSLKFENRELLKQGPDLNIWRAPSDNDKGFALGYWKKEGFDKLTQSFLSIDSKILKPGVLEVVVRKKILTPVHPELGECTYTYTIFAEGDIFINHNFQLNQYFPFLEEAGLPRIGLQMVVAPGFENYSYYGKGPWENYIDRNEGALTNLYASKVDEQYFPYSKPQHTGNRTKVQWAALTDNDGIGLAAYGFPEFESTVLHYSEKELEKDNTAELVKSENTYWSIDNRQMGLGGGSCGPPTRADYLIKAAPVNYNIHLKPINTKKSEIFDLEVEYPRVAEPILAPVLVGKAFANKFQFISPTEKATIQFTNDGTKLYPNSPTYKSAFEVKNKDLRYRATKEGMLPSTEQIFSSRFIKSFYFQDSLRFRERNVKVSEPTADQLKNVPGVKVLYTSDTARMKQDAFKFNLPIEGLRQIQIKVIDSDNNAHWDHFDLGNLKLVKKDGKEVFISDLDVPFHDRLTRDKTIDKKEITINGKTYKKGLGLHSPVELWLDLSTDEFKSLQGEFGTDDEVAPGGSSKAILKVSGIEK
jgi:hypothetical protein